MLYALQITDNPLLVSLNGLQLGTLDGTSPYLSELSVAGNAQLQSLDGLVSADDLTASRLHLTDNAMLEWVAREFFIGAVERIEVSHHPSLVSLEGILAPSLDFDFILHDNDALVSMDGLGGFGSIFGEVRITDNDALEDVSVLNDMSTVGSQTFSQVGRLTISNNDSLVRLALTPGPYRLYAVVNAGSATPGMLTISGNDALEEIAGFPRLDGWIDLAIESNPSLTSIEGFDALEDADDVWIRNNPQLPTSEAERFAVRVGGDTSLVSGNGPD